MTRRSSWRGTLFYRAVRPERLSISTSCTAERGDAPRAREEVQGELMNFRLLDDRRGEEIRRQRLLRRTRDLNRRHHDYQPPDFPRSSRVRYDWKIKGLELLWCSRMLENRVQCAG